MRRTLTTFAAALVMCAAFAVSTPAGEMANPSSPAPPPATSSAASSEEAGLTETVAGLIPQLVGIALSLL